MHMNGLLRHLALIQALVTVLVNAAHCLACAQEHMREVHYMLRSECSQGTQTVPGIGTQPFPSPPEVGFSCLAVRVARYSKRRQSTDDTHTLMLADQNASDDAEAADYPLSCEIPCL